MTNVLRARAVGRDLGRVEVAPMITSEDVNTRPRRSVVQARPNRLRWLRENWSHLTQEEMSLLTGFDMTSISRHESSTRVLTDAAIEKYARIFKIPTWQIFIDPAERDEPIGEISN